MPVGQSSREDTVSFKKQELKKQEFGEDAKIISRHGFTPSEALDGLLIQRPSDLFDLVSFEHIVWLDVIEPLQANPALHASGNLFDVLFDSP